MTTKGYGVLIKASRLKGMEGKKWQDKT